jgi:hypothetical protein
MTDNKKAQGQMNLPLCQSAPMELPRDKQRELAAALADLLWNAAVADDVTATKAAGEES